MDGLLINTEPFYTKVTKAICERYGKVYTYAHKANMLGRDASKTAQYLVEALDLPLSAQEFNLEKDNKLRELFPQAQAMPGAYQLTQNLYQANIPQAVGTSSKTEFFHLKTQAHQQWFKIFNTIITADHPEVKQAKPAPDIFLTAAKNMQANPKNCLVFEDAPAGVQAAKAAGMQVIAVPDANIERELFTQADAILDCLTEFCPQEWQII